MASSSHTDASRNKGKENIVPEKKGDGKFNYQLSEELTASNSNNLRCRCFVGISQMLGCIRRRPTLVCIS